MKPYWIVYLFLLMSNVSGWTQVLPPNLLCVGGETIQWENVNNPCGPNQAYELYFSTDPNGPFTLLATINDPTQTSYNHTNPSNQVYYYYMTTVANCPGEPVIPSDTITNQNPAPADITSVSVDGSSVVINWEASTTSPLLGYIIYRLIGINVDPIDTVLANTQTYTDITGNPNIRSEQYFILALDFCGNTSIFLDPHRTILLEGNVSVCERSLDLQWNLYQNWPSGVATQELYISQNGSPYQLEATLDNQSTSYQLSDLENQAEYCFYVEAVAAGSGLRSRSNEYCGFFEISEPLQDYTLRGITITEDETIQLDWSWSTSSDLSNYQIINQMEPSLPANLAGSFDLSGPLEELNGYEDLGVNTNVGPWTYYLEVTDACGGTTGMSQQATTIFLEGEQLPTGENQLNWTPLILPNTTVLSYDIYKETPAGFGYLGNVDGATLEFLDDSVDPIYRDYADIQYYVVGRASLSLPEGNNVLTESRSNTVAIDQAAFITAPNVFSPGSLENDRFQPFLFHGENAAYRLQIYNRWGQLVFETRDQGEAWDGRCGGQVCPQGVYVYLAELNQPNGNRVVSSGDVLLLR